MEKEKYYLFVDECGDQNLSNYDALFPIFTLCGVIVSEQAKNLLDQKICDLKRDFWGNRKIILHSRDIRKCQNGFEILFDLEVKKRFYDKINEILGQEDLYKVICCSILKKPYIRQYGKLNDVYAQSMSFLIERSIFYIESLNRPIDLNIIVEMRGKKEDANLYKHFINLTSRGTYWISPERLRSHLGKFEFKPKKADICCLQIADLIAYPITRHILDPDAVNFSYDIIKHNIYRENEKQIGLKIIPKLV